MKPKAGHTTMKTGARVVAFMRDGSQVVGRFKERKGRFVILDTATINVADMRTLGYWKQGAAE